MTQSPTTQPIASPTPTPSETAIALQNVHFDYPDQSQVLRALTLSIAPGEKVALVGANGCGKTTLFLLLGGVLTPSQGTLHLFGQPVQPGHFRAELGMVFQNPDDQLFSATVWDDVAFGPGNMGLAAAAIADRTQQALALTNVAHLSQRPPHHLSGGEKKRVAIAGVLAMQPKILLLDEPSAQLDPRARRQLIHLLGRLPQTQIIATHDLDLALELCDRTLVLSQGQLVYDGATQTVMQNEAFLTQHALEPPLSFRRPYCDLA